MKSKSLNPPDLALSDPLNSAIFFAFADDSLRGEERQALARALVNPGFVARCLLALERDEASCKEGKVV
jgi:hypothetical protein